MYVGFLRISKVQIYSHLKYVILSLFINNVKGIYKQLLLPPHLIGIKLF